MNTGTIVGIVLGGVAGLVLVSAGAIYIALRISTIRHRRDLEAGKLRQSRVNRQHGAMPISPGTERNLRSIIQPSNPGILASLNGPLPAAGGKLRLVRIVDPRSPILSEPQRPFASHDSLHPPSTSGTRAAPLDIETGSFKSASTTGTGVRERELLALATEVGVVVIGDWSSGGFKHGEGMADIAESEELQSPKVGDMLAEQQGLQASKFGPSASRKDQSQPQVQTQPQTQSASHSRSPPQSHNSPHGNPDGPQHGRAPSESSKSARTSWSNKSAKTNSTRGDSPVPSYQSAPLRSLNVRASRLVTALRSTPSPHHLGPTSQLNPGSGARAEITDNEWTLLDGDGNEVFELALRGSSASGRIYL